jgi:hypothetical protein
MVQSSIPTVDIDLTGFADGPSTTGRPSARIRVDHTELVQSGAAHSVEPITLGLPFKRGACIDDRNLSLSGRRGAVKRIQTRVLNRWPDGSIKWLLLDFQRQPDDPAEFTLGQAPGDPPPGAVVAIEPTTGAIRVDTGAARFTIDRTGFPFSSIQVGDVEILEPARTRLAIESADGEIWRTRVDDLTVEESGPLRAVVRVSGVIADASNERLNLIARLHFFAGLPTVRLAITIRNPRRATHPGGFWELGDPNSALLRDVSLIVGLRGGDDGSVLCSPEIGVPLQACQSSLELYQDSSGGKNWASETHVNREGRVPNSFNGYRHRDGMTERIGSRATPYVAVTSSAGTWASVGVPYFWQNFPRSICADSRAIAVGLWPRQYADAHELQPGEQKTHVVFLNAGDGHVSPGAFEWCRRPSSAHADPSWYCASGAIPHLVPAAEDPQDDYLRLVDAAINGPNTFEHKREVVDEYGWRNFGDLYADHEAALDQGPAPLVSHYNNQYDAIAGFACHFMRTGDVRWWRAMHELAAHVVDIDIYHTDGDRSIYNRGLFWHTFHYAKADRSTHRTYATTSSADGGGPSAEHNYATGLVLHYFLTGDVASRDAAIDLAGWILSMEDGRRAPLGWLAAGATGFASASDSPSYHGPGRGPANSILVLLDAHQLTGERRYLTCAEALIRRCIHPDDDIAERRLQDVEQRWFYTLFLQALGRYLDYKRERDEVDDRYAYAQASLLRYARWMLEHESPYLDRPEILEYPNETWIAQDMRKSEVFAWAAAHANGEERPRFNERSAFFFEYSTKTLLADPRRANTRPLVLMLTNGWRCAGLTRETPGCSPGALRPDFGAPTVFVPQKVKAIRRAKILAGSAVIAVILAAMKWLF